MRKYQYDEDFALLDDDFFFVFNDVEEEEAYARNVSYGKWR